MVRLHSRESRIILWPIYFDRRFSRAKGRRISNDKGLNRITLEEMVHAANQVGLKFEIDNGAKHPSDWWERSGRILVISDKPKTELISLISNNIERIETKKKS